MKMQNCHSYTFLYQFDKKRYNILLAYRQILLPTWAEPDRLFPAFSLYVKLKLTGSALQLYIYHIVKRVVSIFSLAPTR